MELNQLPECYEGEQKRETEFASPGAKLAFDAENLITTARKFLESEGTNKASNDEILNTIGTIVGVHRKDFTKALPDTEQTLEGAVKAKLYAEDELARLAEEHSRKEIRAEYETFIDTAKLSETDSLKLKEMMSEAGYANAVKAAQKLKASKIPTYEEIAAELMTYTPERLKDICAEMEKPKLQIISDRSFDENIAAMNENKDYTSADGKSQEDSYVYRGSDSPYDNLKKSGKVKVKITDGVVHPKQLDGISRKLGERRTHLTKRFEARSMRLANHVEMQTLIQQSLIEAKETGDNSLIVDNWEKWAKENIPGTVTLLDPSELTESTLVAFSHFGSYDRQANFNAVGPSFGDDGSRGRASVQVFEI